MTEKNVLADKLRKFLHKRWPLHLWPNLLKYAKKMLAFRIFPLRCFMFVSSGTKANTCVLHCWSTYIPNYIACAKIQKQVSYLDRRGDRHDRATAWPHKIECSYSKKDWRPTKSQISKGFKWNRSSHSKVVDINVYYKKTILW